MTDFESILKTAHSTQNKSVISVPIKDIIFHYLMAHFYDIPGVSHLVVKLHSPNRYRLDRRTPYAYSLAVDGSILIVAVRECIVVFGSVSAPRPILGVGAPSVLCRCL